MGLLLPRFSQTQTKPIAGFADTDTDGRQVPIPEQVGEDVHTVPEILFGLGLMI